MTDATVFRTLNPATEALVASFETQSSAQAVARLEVASSGQQTWSSWSFDERAQVLAAAAGILESEADRWGKLMALEMGKPFSQGVAEAKKCAWVCRYYADQAEGFLRPENAHVGARKSYVRFDPLGLVLAIMPWNFPFWQVFRLSAPAMMAGNGVVLKHAPNVPQCARALVEIFERAGVPDGVFSSLMVTEEQVKELIADDRIAAVSLTGSERAGQAVAALAGAHLKKVVLELGGSDPFIVLEDADIERAAKVGVAARMLNTGQSCIAAKRFLVEESVAEAFRRALLSEVSTLRLGDPMAAETDLGPLAREDLRAHLQQQVSAFVEHGASCLMGGQLSDGPGFFYPPTVLADVQPGSSVWEEEIFGPVVVLSTFSDLDEATQLANQTPFGLGASIWTKNRALAEQLATQLQCGAVFINEMVKSDPRLPFGGVKRSGFGRELGRYGLLEFVNIKTVWVD